MQATYFSEGLGLKISNPFTDVGDECIMTERIKENFDPDQSELLLFFKHFDEI